MTRLIDQLVCLTLTLVTAGIGGVMWWHGGTTPLEAISFVTGALCVWLTVRESVWNFPISLLNNVAFLIVFSSVHLFADAGLQVVYFVLALIGWYQWLYGGANRTALKVTRAASSELLIVIASGAASTVLLWQLLGLAGGSASCFDALTTSLSLCAQWLLNRKKLETWFFWIAADLVFIPLFIYKGLYLTSGLYCVFLLMCLMGLQQWRESMRSSSPLIDTVNQERKSGVSSPLAPVVRGEG
jgi:nicotinamide mononucleotide transporter